VGQQVFHNCAIQHFNTDEGFNATREPYREALTAAGVTHENHTYAGTLHGFHNDSTPRFGKEATDLAWERTIAFFNTHLR
jgi:carboxymethylenebutenolidase